MEFSGACRNVVQDFSPLRAASGLKSWTTVAALRKSHSTVIPSRIGTRFVFFDTKSTFSNFLSECGFSPVCMKLRIAPLSQWVPVQATFAPSISAGSGFTTQLRKSCP